MVIYRLDRFSIYQTQSKILTLSSELDNLQGSQVAKAKEDISDIVAAVNNDLSFLNTLGLESYATELATSIGDLEAAVIPWLGLKQELGFNIEEGKLGELKQLATIIEQKLLRQAW